MMSFAWNVLSHIHQQGTTTSAAFVVTIGLHVGSQHNMQAQSLPAIFFCYVRLLYLQQLVLSDLLQADIARRVPSLQEEARRISSHKGLDAAGQKKAIRDR